VRNVYNNGMSITQTPNMSKYEEEEEEEEEEEIEAF
jgi:hypothetical protein